MSTTHAPQRWGNLSAQRPSTRMEARSNALATQWGGRDLTAQCHSELRKTQKALLACNVVPNNPMFDRPSRLLTQINSILGPASA